MKYLRRFLGFLASRLVVITLVVALLVMIFYTCVNYANIYILLSDGMKARAEVVLTREDAKRLNDYFRAEFLEQDDTLNVAFSENSPYMDYDITEFDHLLKVESIRSWPWEDTAQAVILERVPKITGSAIASKKTLVTDGQMSATPPGWQGGTYSVTLYRLNGQWKIAGLQQTQVFVEPTPEPTIAPTPEPTQAAEQAG